MSEGAGITLTTGAGEGGRRDGVAVGDGDDLGVGLCAAGDRLGLGSGGSTPVGELEGCARGLLEGFGAGLALGVAVAFGDGVGAAWAAGSEAMGTRTAVSTAATNDSGSGWRTSDTRRL